VFEVGLTVILGPVPNTVPPHEPEYQVQFAPFANDPPFTDKVADCP
jgi:hypothetical protein